MRENGRTKILVTMALLISIDVILTRLLVIEIPPTEPIFRISLGFIPIAICAMMFGTKWAALSAAIADIIGAFMFPAGPYFPGFTVSAALTGTVFGIFLHKSKGRWLPILFASAINCLIISLFIQPIWLSMLFGAPYLSLLPTRLVQSSIMIVLHVILLDVIRADILPRIRESDKIL